MAADKRKRIQKYFKPFPKWTVVLIVLGVPALALDGAGIVLILIGLVGMLAWGSGRPSDRQMDTWIAEDVEALEPRALHRTGLEGVPTVGDTVIVTGPRFWNTGGAEVALKRGRDRIVRFTPVGVTVIFFTEDQLVAYQCALDLMTGQPLSESTDEYFYQDVVSVSTESKSMSWDKDMLTRQGRRVLKDLIHGGRLQLTAAEVFVLTTAGGTSLEVVLTDPKLIDVAKGSKLPTTEAERAVASVRTMLRQKKRRE